MIGERAVLRELEHTLYLSEILLERLAEVSDLDLRRLVTKDMHRATLRLLETHGNNWVDCSSIFGAIFGSTATVAQTTALVTR